MDGGFDEGVGELELGCLGGFEARFETIAKRHQFVDFRHDAVLFGEGRERD